MPANNGETSTTTLQVYEGVAQIVRKAAKRSDVSVLELASQLLARAIKQGDLTIARPAIKVDFDFDPADFAEPPPARRRGRPPKAS